LDTEEQDKVLAGSNVHERVQKVVKGSNEVADRGDVSRLLEAVAGLH
jgi:DNA damage-binding protein 1